MQGGGLSLTYCDMQPAIFISRPNRFIAEAEIAGERRVCHVKNTGRCAELLTPGAEIWVQSNASPSRKTAFDLIAVRKGRRLINMDAAAPNAVFGEYCAAGRFVPGLTLLRPETRYGDSRLDFYMEAGVRRIFAEVKGVTLEDRGVVRFPDAPTERGVKHLRSLMRCVSEGYEAWAVFIVQMEGVRWFEPNRDTHPEFADALCSAERAGVHLLALDCAVTETSIAARGEVPIRL